MLLPHHFKLPAGPPLVAQTCGLPYRRLAACRAPQQRQPETCHSSTARTDRLCSWRIPLLWRTLATMLVAFLAFAPLAHGGAETSMPEYQVKALFLFNFAKYVEWPASAFASPVSPLTIGILGDSNFGDLNRVLKDRTIGGRKIIVRQLSSDQDMLDCQILFIGSSERGRLLDILKFAATRPILTVSEIEHFTELGGIIGFVKKDDRIRLEIDLEAAQRAQLQLSSKLLSVADSVRGKH